MQHALAGRVWTQLRQSFGVQAKLWPVYGISMGLHSGMRFLKQFFVIHRDQHQLAR